MTTSYYVPAFIRRWEDLKINSPFGESRLVRPPDAPGCIGFCLVFDSPESAEAFAGPDRDIFELVGEPPAAWEAP